MKSPGFQVRSSHDQNVSCVTNQETSPKLVDDKYLYNMFSTTYNYKTREADSGRIRNIRRPELELSKDSFRWRAAASFNQLPESIRNAQSLQGFKLTAKQWVRQNIELSWEEWNNIKIILLRHPGRVSQWMYARLALALALSMTVAVCQSVLSGYSAGQVSQWLYARLILSG